MFMMTTILKNLFTGYATRLYPVTKVETFRQQKGQLKLDIEKCTLCGVCRIKCPSQCISVDKAAKTWEVDPFACVYCGICVEACPTKCLYQEEMYKAPLAAKDTVKLTQPPPQTP